MTKKDSQPFELNDFHEFIWALTGLMLTVFGTFVEVFLVLPTTTKIADLNPTSLGITYQLLGVFFTGCVGGKNAGAYAQVAYVILGLFRLPVFYQGGSFDYLQQPSFGYILGFIPGAWLCGFLCLPGKKRLELFVVSAFFGLLVIHFCGVVYLLLYTLIAPFFGIELADNYFFEAINLYSFSPFFAQIAIICVMAILAFVVRLILFY